MQLRKDCCSTIDQHEIALKLTNISIENETAGIRLNINHAQRC
jgi:hypothetical protein